MLGSCVLFLCVLLFFLLLRLSTGGVVDPVFAGDRHTYDISSSTVYLGRCHQCQIVFSIWHWCSVLTDNWLSLLATLEDLILMCVSPLRLPCCSSRVDFSHWTFCIQSIPKRNPVCHATFWSLWICLAVHRFQFVDFSSNRVFFVDSFGFAWDSFIQPVPHLSPILSPESDPSQLGFNLPSAWSLCLTAQ